MKRVSACSPLGSEPLEGPFWNPSNRPSERRFGTAVPEGFRRGQLLRRERACAAREPILYSSLNSCAIHTAHVCIGIPGNTAKN